MSTPTETPPATTATEPEVAKDAKGVTLTVDVAAAADKGDTKQQPPESPEIVTPGGTILAKVPEPETGLCSIGVSRERASPTPDEDEKAEGDEAGDKKDDDAPKEVSESVKRARKAAATLEEALQKDGDDKAAAEEPPAKKAAVEEAPKEAPKEAETTMPPAVCRQMTTLSPEVAVLPPPALQREATVAA